ncbi:MAG: endolytic transglycosylase MltG [Clostridium sp.]|nr:endolytic transglycosylase MltG [Clostridium sp.]
MKIKYFVRGLGVGILVTALLLFIGSTKAQKPVMSDEDVVDRAKQLGMLTKEEADDYRMDQSLDQIKESLGGTPSPQIDSTTLPATTTQAPEKPIKEETAKVTATPPAKPKKKTEKKQEKSKTATLTIKSGMTTQAVSRVLYEENVIGSEEDFITYMKNHNLTAKLQVGKYEIPTDATHAEIASIITKK